MSLTTPERIRRLQRKLYVQAKVEPTCRFHQLYDKVYREDILEHAYRLAKSQNGAGGVDGVSFADIETRGEGEWLAALRKELHDKTYRPDPVRRVYDRVVRFLKKRRQVSSRGTEQFPGEKVFGELGIQRLRSLAYGD